MVSEHPPSSVAAACLPVDWPGLQGGWTACMSACTSPCPPMHRLHALPAVDLSCSSAVAQRADDCQGLLQSETIFSRTFYHGTAAAEQPRAHSSAEGPAPRRGGRHCSRTVSAEPAEAAGERETPATTSTIGTTCRTTTANGTTFLLHRAAMTPGNVSTINTSCPFLTPLLRKVYSINYKTHTKKDTNSSQVRSPSGGPWAMRRRRGSCSIFAILLTGIAFARVDVEHFPAPLLLGHILLLPLLARLTSLP